MFILFSMFNICLVLQWSWGSNPMSKLSIGVHQSSQLSSLFDGTGFTSARSSSGSYKYRFERPGTFYFSSGNVDTAGRIQMSGKIIVNELVSSIADITLKINGNLLLVVLSLCIRNTYQFSYQHRERERERERERFFPLLAPACILSITYDQ